jgi:hypothetical protein
MPRQNRVDPYGAIIVDAERGTLMGNRGCLHDAQGTVKKPWARKAWVTCLLEFHGRHRNIMAPNQYTELFFLDEATAFSAGHRPCGECRRSRYALFKDLWVKTQRFAAGGIQAVDQSLHAERIDSSGRKQRWRASLRDLPDGCLVEMADRPALWAQGRLLAWSTFGYLELLAIPTDPVIDVLTPRSICETFAAGYVPEIHRSAELL